MHSFQGCFEVCIPRLLQHKEYTDGGWDKTRDPVLTETNAD